jgi:hypothetical protein
MAREAKAALAAAVVRAATLWEMDRMEGMVASAAMEQGAPVGPGGQADRGLTGTVEVGEAAVPVEMASAEMAARAVVAGTASRLATEAWAVRRALVTSVRAVPVA